MKTRLLIITGIVASLLIGFPNSDAFFEGGMVIEVPGQIMDISNNVISLGQTMFVNGTFNQPVDDFTANIFKDYEDSSKLVLTLSPASNEFGDFNFNFTIPQDWELGNYHIVLENGLQFMDWEFAVRKNYVGVSLETISEESKPTARPDVLKLKQNWKMIPPLNQINLGVQPDQVKCKENLVLLQKYDGSPACVRPESIPKLIERGWTKDGSTLSKINKGCMTIEQSKQIASFFKTPTYLPEGYSYVCSRSGMPFESYIVYYNQEFPTYWQIHELVSDGAIFIYQIDERNFVGAEKFETFGTAEQRIQETYDSVMDGNPSLNPQLITINDMLAYAVDSCPDCGMQTANFTDDTSIQESTSSETKIKFIDENGVSYMLETTLPLQELIKVAESLQ